MAPPKVIQSWVLASVFIEILLLDLLVLLVLLLGICDSFFAEMKAVLLAINFSFRYGWRWLWLETDSWAVYSCFPNSKYSPHWQLRNKLLQCKDWIRSMDFVVTHTFREGNVVADTLTNAELHIAVIIWWNSPPNCIQKQLLLDSWGVPSFRFC
ncbi:hypothetical protein Dsin_009287 [Dipteronia sinensis]|uniref:RNase H type-1 domain-containing protein n=1 Tax=Dipteronia sinensis TaxID=43782 RepID=A0AAE0EBZ1_9ROSI|nr:hypothetical protein Dsin_009287 [Dipteronia sinensis]